MSLTLDDLDALRRKARDPIPVGELPSIIRTALQIRSPIVHLSLESLMHIGKRHPDISDYELLLLPFVIRHGLIMREKKKPKVILASYQDSISSRRYLAAMKVTSQQCEVWLDSFYRTKPRQTASFLRRCEILKRHD
jgi:hypothetical protein